MSVKPKFSRDGIEIYEGDCRSILPQLPEQSVNCCVTSPPYWGLRDYGADRQIGLEQTPEEFVAEMVGVFREVRRVLRDDGTLWLNLGDSYCGSWGNSGSRPELDGKTQNQREKTCTYINRGGWDSRRNRPPSSYKIQGLKAKDLVGIPWMVAFALRSDGWYLRSDIIWHKPNPMPESTKDRPTKSHEYIFLMSKSRKYHYDADAIAEKCIESNDARPRMGQGPNTKYNQKRKKMKMPDGWDTGDGGHGSFHRNGREKGKADNADVPDKKNKRTVWTVPTEPYPEAHFATFPKALIEPCILAGCPAGGTVLDPFTGSGTTALVAQKNGCKFIGCEVNPEYVELASKRFKQKALFPPQ